MNSKKRLSLRSALLLFLLCFFAGFLSAETEYLRISVNDWTTLKKSFSELNALLTDYQTRETELKSSAESLQNYASTLETRLSTYEQWERDLSEYLRISGALIEDWRTRSSQSGPLLAALRTAINNAEKSAYERGLRDGLIGGGGIGLLLGGFIGTRFD